MLRNNKNELDAWLNSCHTKAVTWGLVDHLCNVLANRSNDSIRKFKANRDIVK